MNLDYDDDHLPDWLFAKSPLLRGLAANATKKNQHQIAEDTKLFFMQAVACVLMWWTAIEIIVPVAVTAGIGPLMRVLLGLFVLVVPVFGALCAVLAAAHAAWYARVRWQNRPTAGGVSEW